ncbi:MAG: KH domain-containing protein [Ktedonobacterales bacterium]
MRVSEGDLGKVIGRQGRVAKAIRSLMRASGNLSGKQHIGLEIDDRGPQAPDA